MRASAFLALRLVRRRSTPLLRSSALAALIAVALGVAALVVVLALMTGYGDALRAGIMTATGDAVVLPPPGDSPALTAARLRREPALLRLGEVAYLPGLLQKEEGSPVVVTVKAGGSGRIAALPPDDGDGPLAVAVGQGVARRLGLAEGEVALLQTAVEGVGLRSVTVKIADVFETGFAELDEGWVLTSFAPLADRLGRLPGGAVEVWFQDRKQVESLRERVEKICGPGCLLTTWEESEANRALFAALTWQKLSLALVLSLVVAVGAFEVAAALVVLVTEKRRTLGVLLAVGAQPRLIRRTFLLAGTLLGSAGVGAGLALGIGVVGLLTLLKIPSFPPDVASVYMVERIPFHLRVSDLAVVLAVGILEVAVASYVPARKVARRDPSEVLRWV
ncbi:MAG: ABC transporter permease [Acidobacteriota bacterium]|mgnify:CR=1 FL=1